MKTLLITGKDLKADNGSGSKLSDALNRRLHDATIYRVYYRGSTLDKSTICGIERSRTGWATK